MKKMIAVLAASTMTMTAAPVFSQVAGESAMDAANRREICGQEVSPISAEWLANGSLRVLCPYGTGVGTGAGAAGAGAAGAGAAGAQGALLAGGLSAGAAAGLVTVLVVTVAAGGDGETSTTTTTTTTTTN